MDGHAMKGLLLYPEFPYSSFWSYRHIMPMVGAKAAFPPLGLLTFAALMPPEWSFELVDLNVTRLSDADLRARSAAADAVFDGCTVSRARIWSRLSILRSKSCITTS